MNRRLFALALTTALLAACGTPPADLDLSLRHASAEGRFDIRLEPPATGPAVNQLHAWRVHLARADGTPVSQARVAVEGGMPQHGHGFPTRPRITREIEPGVYALEGMKFSMTGWWDLRLAIETADARDRATFNLVIDETGLRR